MRTNFLLDVSFHRSGVTNTNLYIKAASAPHFCNLIRPFIIPSMAYKLACYHRPKQESLYKELQVVSSLKRRRKKYFSDTTDNCVNI